MHDVEGMRRLTDLMSQVGVTAFALMFAAIQIRWQTGARSSRPDDNLAATRLGKLSAITALWELLTVTLVSVSFSAATRDMDGRADDFMWSWGWRAVAIFCAVTGYYLTVSHLRETRTQRLLGHVATPSDGFQASWAFAPFGSYGALMVVAVWPACSAPYAIFAGVLVWLLLSGLLEVWVTLSPSMLEAELENTPTAFEIPAGASAGSVSCIEFNPNERRPGSPTVVFLPDIWGVKHDLLALGDRICSAGHHVVIVDYYQGRSRPLRWVSYARHAKDKAVGIAREAEAVRDWLLTVRGFEAALVGLSIGGGAAILQTGPWQKTAIFYPSAVPGLVPALRGLDPKRVRVYLAAHDDDALPRDEQAVGLTTVRDVVAKELAGSVVTEPGTRHGYMGTGRSIPVLLRAAFHKWLGPNPVAARRSAKDLLAFLGGPPTA